MFKLGSIVAALAMFTASTYAAGPPIGVATAVGTFSVDDSSVSGSINLADGAKLETSSAPSDVRLQSGGEVRLATRSAGTFFADHVLLDKGAFRVGNFSGLTVKADRLQIVSDEPGTQAIIRVNQKTIEVASLGGSVNVIDSGLLTRIAVGTKMSFQTGATPAQPANTGAAPTPSKMPSDQKTFLWVIGITAVAALAIGLTAAAQGKSPF